MLQVLGWVFFRMWRSRVFTPLCWRVAPPWIRLSFNKNPLRMHIINHHSWQDFLSHAHAQGVKQSVCPSVVVVVVVVVVGTKIARSRDLGICACCKHNELVDICEKLVSVRFKLLNRAHKCYKLCIFHSACLWFTDHTHWSTGPCAFCPCAQVQHR